jgi:diaminopimelate epimerase
MARDLCDRHYGVGADGLIVVFAAERGVGTRIFNADGGEAEVSGNGTRCVAAWLAFNGRWESEVEWLSIQTLAGEKRVRRRDGLFEMEVGVPRLSSDAIPIATAARLETVIGYPVELNGRRFEITATSMGNPHCSVFVDDTSRIDFRGIGAELERHELFPERTNVEFIRPVSRDRLRVVFWERGVGETQSSGTGASAACVAAVLNGLANRKVDVETPAGDLQVEWRETDGVVVLTGPAEPVCKGRTLTQHR